MSAGPDPTPAGYHWRCNSCPWRGHDLAAAKSHLLANRNPWTHMPFECETTAGDEILTKIARRVMLPKGDEPDRVFVSTWQSARRHFNDVTGPLIENLRARRGRLRASVEG